jgi:AcrR family transcriptional regulator
MHDATGTISGRTDMSDETRDRKRTEETILAAACTLIAEEGFQGLGINAVARAAGCDKKLIYRYYEGMDGLVEAVGTTFGNDIRRKIGPSDSVPETYADAVRALLLAYLELFRNDRLFQKVTLWEMAESGPLVGRFSRARGNVLQHWVTHWRGSHSAPAGADAPLINALLIGGIQQLVLSAGSAGRFAGLDLLTEADWQRVTTGLAAIIDRLYAPA